MEPDRASTDAGPASARPSVSPPRRGLTGAEAAARLARVGPNVLPAGRPPRVWRRIAAQFVHFFALLLWAAGLLALLGGLPALGFAIFGVVVLNGVFAFAQEHRAENAAARLRDLVPRRATVVRDGRTVEVDATSLVPGDLVVLAGGDRVSADQRIVEGHGVVVDESVLTGESAPVEVAAGGLLRAGCFVVQGEGLAEVETTGAATELGRVAVLTHTVHRPATPLAQELHRLVRAVAIIAVTAGIVFFGIVLLLDTPPSDGFVFGVGVTVALVPEGLLPTVTLSLAVGAQRMAGRNALVRRLESVETLGSTTFICTDKTGTLTQNRMNVTQVWTEDGAVTLDGVGYEPTAAVSSTSDRARVAAVGLAVVAQRCSVGRAVVDDGEWRAQGDPMEAALDALCHRLDASVDDSVASDPDVTRFPFDAGRRLMSVVTPTRVLVKGAPDAVLSRCRGDLDDARLVLDEMARAGLRVLAVAARPAENTPPTAEEAEQGLDLLGLVGIVDPPRPGAAEAVAACRSAGIGVAMVTGDHLATATAIAEQVGLCLPGSPRLIGADLPDDDQVLAAMLDHDGAVIARVTPEDKLRITRALQLRGHVVAMTGDGVNDGPALQEADIGVAMGRSGTDVAREAADLVLLDDDFATIVQAVAQGRATFHNARQFLTYHLTDNVAELTPFVLWALSGGRFPLALGVLQILALDLGTDTLSAAALGAEPPADDVLRGPPARGRLLDRRVAVRAFAVLGPIEALFGIGAFLAALGAGGWRPGDDFPTGATLAAASGATFLTVILAQTANAFACRNPRRPGWRRPLSSNRFLLVAAVLELAFGLTVLLVAPVADLLDHATPPLAGWVVAVLAMPAVLLADALVKAAADRRPRPDHGF